jgi:hypothetical protein
VTLNLPIVLLVVGVLLIVVGILEVVRRVRGDRALGVILMIIGVVVLFFSGAITL